MGFLRAGLTAALILASAGILWLLLQEPRADREWLPEQEHAPTAITDASGITIRDVRDWTYDEESVRSQNWVDITVDLKKVVRAWFLIEPFSDWKAVGHTFLSFEFEDGTVLSFSVEARRESDETYSAFRGLFRTYELSYQWGMERDFVARRLIYLNHPLRLYRLELEPEAAQALFRSLAEETTALAGSPRFYNTLTANCTNMLARIVNEHYPRTLPYDLSWNLTGYADLYLMKQGLIKASGTYEKTRVAADLTAHRDAVRRIAFESPKDFSMELRNLLASQ